MEQNQETNQNQDINNQTVEVAATPVSASEAGAAVVAPRMYDLLKKGWQFLLLRIDLVKWYMALLFGVTIASSPFVMEAGGITSFVAMIAGLVMMIFLAMNTWAIIYAVSQDDVDAVSYKTAFDWSSKNFFSLLWISILSGLAIIFGFALLIIPGIIISVYLYFSLYAFVLGSGTGVKALKQSYHDVKGRWWTVAIQLLVLGLWIFLIYIVAGIVYSIFSTFTGEASMTTMAVDVLLQSVVGGAVGVMSMYAVAQYYKYIRSTRG